MPMSRADAPTPRCSVCGVVEPPPPARLDGWLKITGPAGTRRYCPKCVPAEELATIQAITPMPCRTK